MRALLALALLGCGGTIDNKGDGGAADLASPVDANADRAMGDAPSFQPAPHSPWPQFPSGKTLAPFDLVPIVAANETRATDLFNFSDQLVSGAWWSAVGQDYALGASQPGPHVTGATLPSGIDVTQLDGFVTQALAGAHAPNGHTFYHLFIPDGVTILDGGQPAAYCGAHHAYGGLGDLVGFTQRCAYLPSRFDTVTNTASHEVIEAATDPTGGYALGTLGSMPWQRSIWSAYEATGEVEVGDLCDGTVFLDGGFNYQRSWSNSAARAGGDPCVPALAAPYMNASVPNDWYTIAAGQTITIPVTGWSTAPTGDWPLRAYLRAGSVAGFTAKPDAATHVTIGNNTFPTLNNGTSATLTVTAPNAPSGSFQVIALVSFPPPMTSPDSYHFWLVGVYVP
jgi:hypothetical protein